MAAAVGGVYTVCETQDSLVETVIILERSLHHGAVHGTMVKASLQYNDGFNETVIILERSLHHGAVHGLIDIYRLFNSYAPAPV